jgi:hypothetical protein
MSLSSKLKSNQRSNLMTAVLPTFAKTLAETSPIGLRK